MLLRRPLLQVGQRLRTRKKSQPDFHLTKRLCGLTLALLAMSKLRARSMHRRTLSTHQLVIKLFLLQLVQFVLQLILVDIDAHVDRVRDGT